MSEKEETKHSCPSTNDSQNAPILSPLERNTSIASCNTASQPPTPAAPITHVELTHSELSVAQITSLVSAPHCGAISLFVGTTRDLFEDKQVVSLEYEAYQGMAEKEMLKLCQEARDQWPVANIAIIHRLGRVLVCEASIIVAVSSVHRVEAMAATAFIMDRIKARVPVWKNERYQDGSATWKENKECSWRSK